MTYLEKMLSDLLGPPHASARSVDTPKPDERAADFIQDFDLTAWVERVHKRSLPIKNTNKVGPDILEELLCPSLSMIPLPQ